MRPSDAKTTMVAIVLLLLSISITTAKASPLNIPSNVRDQVPLSVQEVADLAQLEMPMHTTALMAGEAWALTERVRERASRTAEGRSAPTQPTSPYDAYEL
ncbi:hypothetical protein BDV96DRAFT_568661 [Lophiotrema nucula]|uniref:Secreted protein n=1 Tax=Lophiotrema nucula TaxID=690887 RepID=A0A6A5ZI15_9PLEO|nr:hypothetical protein BDV96DRAFT_568661 [Lophiotrema nucula]